MTRVLVTGGTGTLGRELVPRLADDGYTVRIMSRRRSELAPESDLEWAQADLASGEGLDAAVADVDVVVHGASSPFPPFRGPKSVDVRGTRRLVSALDDVAVNHLLYVSIAGIDEIPYHYYRAKLDAESTVEDGGVPATILRATQFHELGDSVFRGMRWLPVWPLVTAGSLQPIASREVAGRLTELVGAGPGGRVPPIGGPEVLTVGEAAKTWKRASDVRRPVVSVPSVGRTLTRLRAGDLTVPDNPYGTVTFAEWLEEADAADPKPSVDELGRDRPTG